MTEPLLEARGLTKLYPVGSGKQRGQLHPVDGVDLAIGRGESVGLVGEDGCGKSTLARILARLTDPSAGKIRFDGQDITDISLHRFVKRPERARIQVMFQDPTDSLNPHFTTFEAIADPVRRLSGLPSRAAVAERVRHAVDLVGLSQDLIGRYPHQLSGGQRARSASRGRSWSSRPC